MKAIQQQITTTDLWFVSQLITGLKIYSFQEQTHTHTHGHGHGHGHKKSCK